MRGRPPSIPENQILDAARDVFREQGHAATTAKIAARAGVSEGILFYRYKTKEALLAALIQRETQPPEELRALARAAGEADIEEQLRRVVDIVLGAVLRAHPFVELAHTSDTAGEVWRALFAAPGKAPPQQMVELISAYLRAEIRLGRLRKLDPTPLAHALLGGCVDFVRFGAAGGGRANKAFREGLVDAVLHGLMPPRRARIGGRR